nr:PREDICTED: UDP-glucuronosyltransferase-like isoform X3 [Bemisia tabaci]XP_018900052.1 PREDICTED: UDP-glucuronosyltransferase-like isoform X3 [Bemisia tabaci]XP_018900053.1 PREDICTED: UDP-glucuronosyltransferase-like isoform X3 [Bemisia tabaci]XP_018900054.1 PREDICTED: UDP-glucuronosyltransferase-like isoform X3 [Bemisia tabaci]
MQFSIVLTVVCFAISGSAHNILVFLPNKIWSHYFQVEPIFHALANRGHNLTIVSPFPPKNKNPNIRHFPLEMIDFDEIIPNTNWMEHSFERWHAIFSISLWKKMADARIPKLLESSVFQDLYNDDNKFDLIFTELFFGQEALVVLGHIFNAPVVTYSSYGYDTEIFRYSGAMNAVAYLPWKDSSYPTVHPSSLLERLDNALISFAVMLFNEYWYFPDHDALLAKHLPGPLPRITDMLRNVSLFILTANTAVDGAKLFPPNVIEISGIHMKEPEPLDKDLERIMNKAKDGVIFFSYGSLLTTNLVRKEILHAYLSAFKELPQTILWKADSSYLNSSNFNIPENVHIRSWFDQKSVLAHPNCVLFMTHGGVSSTMETIRYAVPVIGTPFYGDQKNNMVNAEYLGYGLQLAYLNITRESLTWAINTVLGDSRFKENIGKASKVFTDKPMSSLDTAIYWIEYVIRHEGAHHLKPLTVHMPWYQLFFLDVFVICAVIIFVVIYLFVKLVLFLCRKRVIGRKPLKPKNQ